MKSSKQRGGKCLLYFGTTVSLDARQRMFKGMKGLRDYLTSIKA